MIEIDIEKRVGEFSLVAQLETASNGVTALFGRSGSGKTTLVDMIAGLNSPDSGRISLDNEIMFDSGKGINLPPEKRRLGYVFQEDRLFPHLDVTSNLRYGCRNSIDATEFKKIVDLLGIEHLLARRPASLSGGEKQRVSIGRAILATPRLLLMDEPLASLDAARKDEILRFIEEFSSSLEIPIIYVSHAMDEIIRLADTMVVLSEGRIAATGSVEDITSRLDLRPMTGRYEAGSVIRTIIADHDKRNGLTLLEFVGGKFTVPKIELPIGQILRVRIRARDVSIATVKPQGISINNIFHGTITDIREDRSPFLDVLIDSGVPIWSRITRSSLERLELSQGKQVYAMVKAVAIDRHSLGSIRGDRKAE